MKEIIDFLNTAQVYYLASLDGDQPRVRPIGFVMDYQGKPAFCTSNQKPMYRQMKANPKIEICAVDKNMTTLRLTGKAVFVTSEASQRQAMETMPDLGSLYAVGDGKFEIFRLDDAQAVCTGMDGQTWTLSV